MKRRPIVPVVLCLAGVAAAVTMVRSQPQPADIILSNGKVVTVNDRFAIASAVAIRGERIVAVGGDRDVAAFAGAGTRRIDLGGRTVIPGLIDNHMHLLRAGTTWQYEVRLDGVESRKAALDLLRARARTTPRGEWIYTLGGWAIEQFADDKAPFTRAELDRAVPDHPVFLQASYYNGYLNSRAVETLRVDAPTGVVDERGMRAIAARVPTASGERLEASTRQMLRDVNRMGLTAFGSAGCEADVLPMYQRWASRGELSVRVFCITGALQPPRPPSPLRGFGEARDHYIDHVAYGESVYGPLHDPMFVAKSDPSPAALAEWRRIATGVAQARRQLHVHANLTDTIGAFLDQIDLIRKEHAIGDLRWTLAHVNQINATHLARMKDMGVHAAVHPWAIINGGINLTVFGDAAYDMPPLRTIQESGVVWGFGSDGSRANQIRPFTTLWWAVTGKMVGGAQLLRQTISREQALVAHTRSNAYLLFRERDLGSIETGKLADLAVLDRDYLTVPADQIKDITSVMTIVGGRIVHQSKESGIGNLDSGLGQVQGTSR
jgi:predicted amidohydrolase YtcJ